MANKFKNKSSNTPKTRVNSSIRVSEVRLVGENIDNSGDVVSTKNALNIARRLNLDLVEVNPNTSPSICKIVDFDKYLFEEKKKKKELEKKQKQKNKDLKEIQFRPNIGESDILVKKKKIFEFLEKGHKVKITMRFKGREVQNNKEKGEIILLTIADELTTLKIGKVDTMPKMTGLIINMSVSPYKKS